MSEDYDLRSSDISSREQQAALDRKQRVVFEWWNRGIKVVGTAITAAVTILAACFLTERLIANFEASQARYSVSTVEFLSEKATIKLDQRTGNSWKLVQAKDGLCWQAALDNNPSAKSIECTKAN